jgi:para-nitrobenzyl esterase
MVWIHGAGLTGGSGSEPRYDGEELSKKGAVVITINYRLGPFVAGSPGSIEGVWLQRLGQLRDDGLDRRAAVGAEERENAFGDSRRVTIFES